MYELKEAFVKPRARFGEWTTADIGDVVIADVIQQYRFVYLHLTHRLLQGDFCLDITSIVRDVGVSMTINEYLEHVGDKVLDTHPFKPYLKQGKAIYIDSYRTNLRANVLSKDSTKVDEHYENNFWVTLEAPGLETKRLYDYYLFTVAGMLHTFDYDDNRIYINNAVDTSLVSNQFTIGIIGFEDIGKIERIPITEDMIPTREDQDLKDFTVIKTDRDLSEYTIAMSIGGYLHIGDPDTLSMYGNNSIKINWDRIPLLRRFYESKDVIDLSSLSLMGSTNNPDLINVEDLYSDRVLINYLTLPQSFIILIHNPDISIDLHKAEDAPFYTQLYRHQPLNFPLINETGRLIDYWDRSELGVTSYYGLGLVKQNHLFDTVASDNLVNVTNARISSLPRYPFDKSSGHFIEIKATSLVIDKVNGVEVTFK